MTDLGAKFLEAMDGHTPAEAVEACGELLGIILKAKAYGDKAYGDKQSAILAISNILRNATEILLHVTERASNETPR